MSETTTVEFIDNALGADGDMIGTEHDWYLRCNACGEEIDSPFNEIIESLMGEVTPYHMQCDTHICCPECGAPIDIVTSANEAYNIDPFDKLTPDAARELLRQYNAEVSLLIDNNRREDIMTVTEFLTSSSFKRPEAATVQFYFPGSAAEVLLDPEKSCDHD